MNIKTTFKEWLVIATAAHYKLERYTRPTFVGDKPVPEDLNELTIGQLIELSELGDTNQSLYKVTEIILGLSAEETDRARAVDVVRLVGWTFGEVEKINKLFEKLHTEPTRREKQAGVERLQFGLFGMLDWYAQRMRIQNHDDVLTVPWARIYKCMDMDARKAQYERRLQDIATKEMNHKNQRR